MSVIVIKYGGSLLEDPGHRSAFLKEVAKLAARNKIILVHGGGKEISRQMQQAGLEPTFVDGRRYTDEATMDVVKKALSGLNAEIVKELNSLGVETSGRSGQDGHLLQAKPIPELGRVGMPSVVNPAIMESLLIAGKLSVLYSVAEDAAHQPLNINADDFALALAMACRADRLVFLTDTGGVLDSKGDVIPVIKQRDVEGLIEKQVITGGMMVKARACVDAIRNGVGQVDICKDIKHLDPKGKAQIRGTSFT